MSEDDVKAIQAAVEAYDKTRAVWTRDEVATDEYIDARDYLEGNAPDWLRYLLQERARLQAVAEAARGLKHEGWWKGALLVTQDTWDQLQDALAALDAG